MAIAAGACEELSGHGAAALSAFSAARVPSRQLARVKHGYALERSHAPGAPINIFMILDEIAKIIGE